MRIRAIICIFGLLFLASCQEETIPHYSPCQLVTISDALPVQFWLADCDTYNETVPKGVHEQCFCQPWQRDDEIKIQFKDDTSPEVDYSLLVKNPDGEYLELISVDDIGDGVYETKITPENYGIYDEDIQLLIAESANIIQMLAPSSWDDKGAPFSTFDNKSSTQFIEAVTSADGALAAEMPFVVPAGTEITFRYTVVVGGTWTSSGGIDVSFYMEDSGGGGASTSSLSASETLITANGTYERTVTLTATATTAVLNAHVLPFVASGTANLTITVEPGQVLYVPEEDIVAKSDCLQIATTQDETELFEYANGRNFAGLIYQDISPDATFKIRIPCRFFHEEFPEEDEAIELTSQVVTTSSQLKSQKLLEVKHVPYYFHKKLQLILKHQTLETGGVAYKKEEKYEINKGNSRWPLKSATCLLTEKNSVLRNTL